MNDKPEDVEELRLIKVRHRRAETESILRQLVAPRLAQECNELQTAQQELERLREEKRRLLEFIDKYDKWAASDELCAGPLFDAMLKAFEPVADLDLVPEDGRPDTPPPPPVKPVG